MPKPRRSHRNDLGSLFAATLVTVLGTGICCALFAVGSPDDSLWMLLLIIAPALVFLATLIGARSRDSGMGLGIWHALFRSRAEDDRGIEYQPRRVEPERVVPEGQQRPITADEVRDIQLINGNTWIPARGRRKDADRYLD